VYEVHGACFERATWTLATQPNDRQLNEWGHGVIVEVWGQRGRMKPEPDPPPLVAAMDFIGSYEQRWQRNKAAKSSKGGGGYQLPAPGLER